MGNKCFNSFPVMIYHYFSQLFIVSVLFFDKEVTYNITFLFKMLILHVSVNKVIRRFSTMHYCFCLLTNDEIFVLKLISIFINFWFNRKHQPVKLKDVPVKSEEIFPMKIIYLLEIPQTQRCVFRIPPILFATNLHISSIKLPTL